MKFQDRANSSLFLAVRYKEKGRITRTSDYRFSFGKVVGPERTGKNLAASKEAPSILMKDGAGPLPPFLIQLSDGHGGWLSGDGPLYTAGLEEAEKLGLDYHIIRFPAWPRDRANLEFRAILPQSPEQRFTLPNPKPAGKPSLTSAITPLPHHEVTADFELEIAPSKRTPFPELGTLIEIPTRLTPAASLGPNANWFFSLSRQLTDQWENNLTYHNHNYSPRSSLAGWLTASHSGPYQLICQVTRGPGYPRPEAECTIYAEGQIGADGKTPIIQKLYRSTGVTNASAEAKSPFFQEIGGQGLALDLSFEWDSAKAAKRATISNYSRDNLYLFLDGSPSSTGICQQRGGSSGGGHFGKIRASVLSRWSGNLSAHQTFKIGSAPSLPPQEFRFIIDGSAP
ncbi:MAG: hypothetical protein Q7Q71_06745 [Verrucomicrobiota bacterium JB023]|nr:hypothetical protein [Verrucomicrobiota bacterium JB023]